MNVIDELQLLRDQLAAMFLLTIVMTKLVVDDARARTSPSRPGGASRSAAAVALACAVIAIAIARESVGRPQAAHTLDVPGSNRSLRGLSGDRVAAGVVDGGLLLGVVGIVYLLAARTAPGGLAEPEGK
jgi:hypothetical protein